MIRWAQKWPNGAINGQNLGKPVPSKGARMRKFFSHGEK